MQGNWLSILVFLPLAVMLGAFFIPKEKQSIFKWIAAVTTFVQLLLSIYIYGQFDGSLAGVTELDTYQFVEQCSWISMDLGSFGKINVEYFLGVDGISISLVLLASFVMFIGSIASWSIKERTKSYTLLYLLLSTAVVGCFVALDLFLFFLFFEFMLLPMYFLIGMWGGPRREYASIKFFLYTLAGSVCILVAMILLHVSAVDPVQTAYNIGLVPAGEAVSKDIIDSVQQLLQSTSNGIGIRSEDIVHTFNMVHLSHDANYLPGSLLSPESGSTILGCNARTFTFILVLFGFAIKLPAVPFHTWLPDAHVEAPTPISVVLAGILLKVGGYGLIRVGYEIFPSEAADNSWMIACFGVIAILYGAYNALAQRDLKKLIAYSSVSHMGFVLLGLAAGTIEGTTGAIFQMFSHGIISSMLFIAAGVIYDRTHDRTIENYKGLAAKMPYYTAFVTVAFFASLGLPGFSGFIGEIFIFIGGFSSAVIPKWMTVLAVFGVVIGAAYYLWALQRMFFGKFWLRNESLTDKIKDLTAREYIMLIPLALLTLLFGLMPSLVLDKISASIQLLIGG